MTTNKYQTLAEMKKSGSLSFMSPSSHCLVCPDLGGRIFAEVCGLSTHRIDLDCVEKPDRPFNNYGGGNFWPAPEGGRFGFNYCGDTWRVQECINLQPFLVVEEDGLSVVISKKIDLVNRSEFAIHAEMKREFRLAPELPAVLKGLSLKGYLSYTTIDSFSVHNSVSLEEGLLASWTLEQFEATENTVAFCVVANPTQAINFDFYEPPHEKITYFGKGFTYKTDGRKAGQIGVKKDAGATCVGFYDLFQGLLCLRLNKGSDGLYFNIADNDQPEGPFSAADNYSIFNSNPDMNAFELETIGAAKVEGGRLVGSEMTSDTTFAVFEKSKDLESFVKQVLGADSIP